jgi:DNA-binding winged helix-turn-helix (wHTH) protein
LDTLVEFGPYRLDLRAQRLWHGREAVPLRAKTWALLRYLVEHPNALISKDELAAAVWAQAVVSDDALARTVGELRRAIKDDAKEPRFIQTVHRMGYRFVARCKYRKSGQAPELIDLANPNHRAGGIFDRQNELSALQSAFRKAASGARQFVFLTGELGVGKTSVLDAFLESLRGSRSPVRIGWARCFEHFGGYERYMPVLEMLERLVRGDATGRVRSVLRREAPEWLAQLPSLQAAGDAELLSRTRQWASPDRMVREFANFVEAICADEPLVIVLEDLHWSDYGTVDLVSALAQRPELTRLLFVGTYRPAEAAVRAHPIGATTATLQMRHLSRVAALEGFTGSDVAEYLTQRLGPSPMTDEVARFVHRQTGGNPLFLIELVEHLLGRGLLREHEKRWVLAGDLPEIDREIPEGLRGVLVDQLRLVTAEERDLLDVASAAGPTFDMRELAMVLEGSEGEVEACCERLCRIHHLLRYFGKVEWPNGSVGGRYGFAHGIYQRLLYDLLPPGRRAMLEERFGKALQADRESRIEDPAADIPEQSEVGEDRKRAVAYLTEAFSQTHGQPGLGDASTSVELLLADLERTAGRARLSPGLRSICNIVLSKTRGYSGPVLASKFIRALDLAEHSADRAARFDVKYALAVLYAYRSDCASAARVCQELLQLAHNAAVPVPFRAQYLSGAVALWGGDLSIAQEFLGDVRRTSHVVPAETLWFGVNPALGAASHENLRRWIAGSEREALADQQRTVAIAERFGHPFSLAQVLSFGALIHALSERWAEAALISSRALAIAAEHGFSRWAGTALVCRGRALVGQGDPERGCREMREGMDVLSDAGVRLGSSLLFSLRAGGHLQTGQWDEGLAAIEEGLAVCRDTTERVFESELWRQKAEVLLRRDRAAPSSTPRSPLIDEACECLSQSLTLARTAGALGLERRAKRSRARLPDGVAFRVTA